MKWLNSWYGAWSPCTNPNMVSIFVDSQTGRSVAIHRDFKRKTITIIADCKSLHAAKCAATKWAKEKKA